MQGCTLTFEVVEKALQLVLRGAKLIATNLDPNCPTSSGTRPGCGAIVAMLEVAAGAKAFSVGKPSPIMMGMARRQIGLRTEEVTMIGDTMETDILGGLQMGYRTVLVLSGSTRSEDLSYYPYQPTVVVDSIADLVEEVDRAVAPPPEAAPDPNGTLPAVRSWWTVSCAQVPGWGDRPVVDGRREGVIRRFWNRYESTPHGRPDVEGTVLPH